MMSDRSKHAVPAKLPGDDLSSLLGPPLLIKGEDGGVYQEVAARISMAVKPKDFLEEIWVRDVADLTWEILRMRRLKAARLVSAMSSLISDILAPVLGYDGAREVSSGWELGNRQAVKDVNKHVTEMGWTIDAVAALSFSNRIDTFDRIDRMLTSAEARRNAALREIERHRATIAAALRQASDNVVEAEFEDLASDRPAQRDVA
jgi:hypothetical protein